MAKGKPTKQEYYSAERDQWAAAQQAQRPLIWHVHRGEYPSMEPLTVAKLKQLAHGVYSGFLCGAGSMHTTGTWIMVADLAALLQEVERGRTRGVLSSGGKKLGKA